MIVSESFLKNKPAVNMLHYGTQQEVWGMLQIRNVKKEYRTGDLVQKALDGVSVNLRDNEFVAILGPSGSGKTTLLNVIGGLDRYDSGELIINGLTTRKYKDKDWDYYRNHMIGFVFQSYNLIPHQTILANVELALTISGISGKERHDRAVKALEKVGLGNQIHKKPAQLSGGQMQRVAIARALVNDPQIVLADEPTGALDSETSIQVMELLKEVARDRLVVMVTHNPDLAHQYATRIITIKDGHLIKDTNPYIIENEQAIVKKTGKSSMNFLTALQLSFQNLRTKKARTLLVSIAGSIGIIGIALIMSISNGVQAYIRKTERETMSEYPLQINKLGMDMDAMINGARSDSESQMSATADPDATGAQVKNTLARQSQETSDNDLSSLKTYLESNETIQDHARAIEYKYGITPRIYLVQNDKDYMVSANASSSMMMSFSGSSSDFYQLPAASDLYSDQYNLETGHWPANANEAILVLNNDGSINDTLLYELGIKDYSEYEQIQQDQENNKAVSITEDDNIYSYDKFIGCSFKVISPSDLYQNNAENNVYVDNSSDEETLKNAVNNGIDLTIVGVAVPKSDVKVTSLSTGVGYTSDLTQEVIKRASQSDAVKAQLANPSINIFTNKSFNDENNSDFSLENLISVDTDALTNAFSINPDNLQLNFDPGQLNFDNIDLSNLIDTNALQKATPQFTTDQLNNILKKANLTITQDNLKTLFTDLYQSYTSQNPDTLSGFTSSFSSWIQSDEGKEAFKQAVAAIIQKDASGTLQPDNLQKVITSIMEGFPEYVIKNNLADKTFAEQLEAYLSDDSTRKTMQDEGTKMKDAISNLDLSDDDIKNIISTFTNSYNDYAKKTEGAVSTDDVISSFQTWMSSELASDVLKKDINKFIDLDALQNAFVKEFNDSMSAYSNAIATQVQNAMTNVMTQVMTQLSDTMSNSMTSLMSQMSNMFNIDTDAFANMIHINTSASSLQSMLSSMLSTTKTTAQSNLATLGYADLNKPTEIDIYPNDFDAKTTIKNVLNDYNQQMKDSGQNDKVIVYTDLVATMMKSVTDIINTISLVLIAFVAISLIVSSIMIGVITYISVLERRKEIGILRALGASKHNITEVFNAETFITGALAGIIGIVTALILLIPGNKIIHHVLSSNEINASLPITAAAGLIVLSIALTLLAGLLPSRKAAKSDPVAALRSE